LGDRKRWPGIRVMCERWASFYPVSALSPMSSAGRARLQSCRKSPEKTQVLAAEVQPLSPSPPPDPNVILSEVDAEQSEAATQSKDPYLGVQPGADGMFRISFAGCPISFARFANEWVTLADHGLCGVLEF
jgi:hypothetical protein